MTSLIVNRKAKFDYEILETYQAGLALTGKMVRQIRDKKVKIEGKFIVWQKKQLQIIGFGNDQLIANIPLLLKDKEIQKIKSGLNIKGNTCIILEILGHKRWLKAKIALVRGKKQFDKRESLKKKAIQMDLEREMSKKF